MVDPWKVYRIYTGTGVLGNKPFKTLNTGMYDDWMTNGINEYMNADNTKPVLRRMLLSGY